ncbi:MAG: hypothetical protein M3416_05765 [Acidobacteriota bacterium]|nr:hypothetical protein [Acidobacteriota bacterium]
MNTTKTLLLAAAVWSACFLAGCASGPPNPGFRVETFIQNDEGIFDDPRRGIDLDIRRRYEPTTGTIDGFLNRRTNSAAYFDAENGIAPADWFVKETDGACQGLEVLERFNPGQASDIYCIIRTTFLFFAEPGTLSKPNPPPNILVRGSGLSSVGGMPVVEYFNQEGTLVEQVSAYEVSVGGTWARGYTPGLSSSPDGSYTMRIRNPDGSIIGTARIDVTSACIPTQEQLNSCQAYGWNWDYYYCYCTNGPMG